ncbi:aminoglycoside phosphotransferase family protein [Aestuariimicrobium soli]|uniref:aminoglycoside phosphotransferase family protein n=1 Tax=Aestuariimicrobium soli TaxID=2035834 RepID=UPI003EC03023
MSTPMHDDQIALSPAAIERLVRDQYPALNGPIRIVGGTGTVNLIARVGDDVTARFPLRHEPPDEVLAQLEQEQRALAELAAVSPVPTPRPLGIGRPAHGYPLPWSLQTWLDGDDGWSAERLGGGTSGEAFADDLATLIAALRAADTGGRVFAGTNRGGSLATHDGWVRTCLAETAALVDAPTLAGLTALWEQFLALPEAPGPDVMTHGDLIPGNVLVRPDDTGAPRLVGVLDGGGFGPADRSLDLVAAWHLLEEGPRVRLRERLGSDELEWQRGRAWAFEQAMGLFWYYRTSNPLMSRLGERTLSRLLGRRLPGR